MAYGGDAVRVEVAVAHQVIDAALETPCPGRNGAPAGRRVPGRVAPREPGINSAAHVPAVRIHVAAKKRGQGVAAAHDLAQRPVGCLGAASGVGGGVVRAARAHVGHPGPRQRDAPVCGQRMIAAEIHRQEDRRRPAPLIRHHQHQTDVRRIGLRTGLQGHQLQCRLAVEKITVLALDVDAQMGRLGRDSSIHVMREQRLEFGAALMPPLRQAGNPPPVQHDQRVRQARLGRQ